MEKAREFFTRTLKTPEAARLLEGLKKPEALEDAIRVYKDIARQLGVALSESGIRAYFEEKMNQQRAEGQLDDMELAQVSGGGSCRGSYQLYQCRKTWKEGENCWGTDRCNALVYKYTGHLINDPCHQ